MAAIAKKEKRMEENEAKSGFLLVDKPVGMTSRQVDNRIGHIFHTKHVGHLGTLDPFASGMLLVSVNKANKALSFVEDDRKTYLARLIFGKSTDTGDVDGKIVKEGGPTSFSEEKVKEVLRSFLGKSLQTPPMTSAIKVEGEALYKKAHRGESIEREKREIEVFSIDFVFQNEDWMMFKATVSKGTYIRVLGEDIAKRLGTIGYLADLRRTQIGEIEQNRMVKLDEIGEGTPLLSTLEFISLPRIELSEKEYKYALNGRRIEFDTLASRVLLVYKGEPIAVYVHEAGKAFRSLRGLF